MTELPEPLLPRIAAGDERAVDECVDRYQRLVWSLARRLGPRPDELEDAVQEIFVEVWRSADRFDATRGTEATFVATIARRRLIDRRRREQNRPDERPLLPDENIPGPDLAEEIDQRSEAGLAARELLRLDESARRLVVLSVIHGLSHGEIALATATPLGTVKSTIRRSLRRVREALEAREAATGGVKT